MKEYKKYIYKDGILTTDKYTYPEIYKFDGPKRGHYLAKPEEVIAELNNNKETLAPAITAAKIDGLCYLDYTTDKTEELLEIYIYRDSKDESKFAIGYTTGHDKETGYEIGEDFHYTKERGFYWI